MTDLISAMMQAGMSPEDIEILKQTTGGGSVDLRLGQTTRMPSVAPGFSFGRPDLTSIPDGPAATALPNASYRAKNVGSNAVVDAAGLYGELADEFNSAGKRIASNPKVRAVGKKVPASIRSGGRKMAGSVGAKLAAVPGMAKVGAAAKVLAPGLGALGGAMAVGDLVLGDESGVNKTMDAAAMAAGGFLGSVGGPLGTAAGVGLGKMASDGIQYLFGDKKTPEQRRMEEALAALGGGRI